MNSVYSNYSIAKQALQWTVQDHTGRTQAENSWKKRSEGERENVGQWVSYRGSAGNGLGFPFFPFSCCTPFLFSFLILLIFSSIPVKFSTNVPVLYHKNSLIAHYTSPTLNTQYDGPQFTAQFEDWLFGHAHARAACCRRMLE